QEGQTKTGTKKIQPSMWFNSDRNNLNEPHTIHAKDKPSQAVVKASLVVRGNIPSGSTATVELSTYSSEVPGVKLCYDKRIQMVSLDSDFIGVEFPVTACPDTSPGTVLS